MQKNKPLDRGDIVYLDFDKDQKGHEIKNHRPALVVTVQEYNKRNNMILCCPITNTIRNHPLEVVLPKGCRTAGAVLINHIRGFDQTTRKIYKIDQAPKDLLDEVMGKLNALFR